MSEPIKSDEVVLKRGQSITAEQAAGRRVVVTGDLQPVELDVPISLKGHGGKTGIPLPGLSLEYADRKPLHFQGRYLWHPDNHTPAPMGVAPKMLERYALGYYRDHLPPAVFAELQGMIPRDNLRVHNLVKAYHTEEEAQQALKNALGRLRAR